MSDFKHFRVSRGNPQEAVSSEAWFWEVVLPSLEAEDHRAAANLFCHGKAILFKAVQKKGRTLAIFKSESGQFCSVEEIDAMRAATTLPNESVSYNPNGHVFH